MFGGKLIVGKTKTLHKMEQEKTSMAAAFRLTQSLTESLNGFKPRTLLHLRIHKDPTFQLKCLKISGRELTDLPPELFELRHLEYLVLSPERESGLHFRLLKVPKNIGEMRQLRILCLDTNELKKLPQEIGNLRNLERLALSNNLLTTLPSSFSDLQKLKHLHLANNYLKVIPACVYSMLNLEFLDASDNKIFEISEDISALVGLETFLLLYNLLETVPESITKCLNLRSLWLGNNRLKYLPSNFGDLTKLDWEFHSNSANIDGNPSLQRPPVEVCRQGPDMIRDYFKRNEMPCSEQDEDSMEEIDPVVTGTSAMSSSQNFGSDWREVPPLEIDSPRK